MLSTVCQFTKGIDAEGKSLHPGLAGLLRDSEHENNHAGMGRMAAPQIPVLHLEAMEKTRNQSEKSHAAGDTRVAGVGCKQLSKSLLAHGEEWSCTKGTLKRKTRTGGIL